VTILGQRSLSGEWLAMSLKDDWKAEFPCEKTFETLPRTETWTTRSNIGQRTRCQKID